jgi:hypothetical protein
MNPDKPQDDKPESSNDYDQLLARIRERREQIRERQGILTDSAELIREERDRR